MTQTIGCVGGANEESRFKKLSDVEIVDKFNDFITMFPTEDLTVLYDKEGGKLSTEVDAISEDIEENQSETQNSDDEDKGLWCITSYLYNKDEKQGVILYFNRNTRKAQGNFILRTGEEEKEYPIYYEDKRIYLVDKNTPVDVKEKLENFKMMYEFIELDRAYLDNLQSTDIMYNPNVPIFDAYYKLEPNDKNVEKIKEVYPNLVIDKNDITLKLDGSGKPWKVTSDLRMKIILNKENNFYITSSMDFRNSLEGEEGTDE